MIRIGNMQNGQILQDKTHVGYAGQLWVEYRLAQMLEATLGVDEERQVSYLVGDVLGPVEALQRTRVHCWQQWQVGCKIVEFTQVFHDFEKFEQVAFAITFSSLL